MKETREFLKSIGMPEGDAYDLPTSEKRFHDGGQYRFEVPGIQSPKVMEALLDEMDKYQISLHRVTQTKGIMMLTDNACVQNSEDRVAANLDIFCGKLQMGGGRTAGPTQDMNDVLTFMLEKNQTYTVKYANEAGKMKEVEVKLGEQPVELKLYMK